MEVVFINMEGRMEGLLLLLGQTEWSGLEFEGEGSLSTSIKVAKLVFEEIILHEDKQNKHFYCCYFP